MGSPFAVSRRINLVGATAESVITIAQAARLVVERTEPSGSQGIARNTVNHRLRHAIVKQKILASIDHNRMYLGNFAIWARTIWPGKFEDLPMTVIVSAAVGTAAGVCSGRGSGIALSSSIKHCHKVISDQHDQLFRQAARLETLQAELDQAKIQSEKKKASKRGKRFRS